MTAQSCPTRSLVKATRTIRGPRSTPSAACSGRYTKPRSTCSRTPCYASVLRPCQVRQANGSSTRKNPKRKKHFPKESVKFIWHVVLGSTSQHMLTEIQKVVTQTCNGWSNPCSPVTFRNWILSMSMLTERNTLEKDISNHNEVHPVWRLIRCNVASCLRWREKPSRWGWHLRVVDFDSGHQISADWDR